MSTDTEQPTKLLMFSVKFRWLLVISWWHQMETFSALLALWEGNPPVTGGFPSQRPVMQSFDVFFDLCLNKRLNIQLKCLWFETLCTHYDITVMLNHLFWPDDIIKNVVHPMMFLNGWWNLAKSCCALSVNCKLVSFIKKGYLQHASSTATLCILMSFCCGKSVCPPFERDISCETHCPVLLCNIWPREVYEYDLTFGLANWLQVLAPLGWHCMSIKQCHFTGHLTVFLKWYPG